jgi:hypothetical protein
MTPAEAATYLNVRPRTLDNWRYKLEGPPYKKLGQLVRYDLTELREWLDASTEAGAA